MSKDKGAGLSLINAQRLDKPTFESGMLSLPFEIQNVIVSSGGQNKAQFDGLPTGGYPGRPDLPCQNIRILLPPDAVPKTVTLSISNQVSQDIEGDWMVAPAPPFGGPDGNPRWPHDVTIVDGMDQAVYSQNSFYPQSHYDFVVSGQWREWKIVSVTVYPYRYNPVTRKLVFLSKGEIQVRYQRDPLAAQNGKTAQPANVRLASQPARRQQLANDCINFAVTAALYDREQFFSEPSGGLTTNYVIITTASIVGQSLALTDFIAAKTGLGSTVRVITEAATADDSHYVTGASCDERANNIRSWLTNHYGPMGIEYVLLIGNPHPSSFNSADSVPMKMCWPNNAEASYKESPTDMYFAELTGNWDLNANTFYGEFADMGAGGVDMFCEVAVGRIPVYDTGATQIGYLDSILNKTVQYQTSSDTSWRTNCLGAAGFQDASFTDGAEMIESFRTNVCAPSHLSVFTLYQQGSKDPSYHSIYPSDDELRGMASGGDTNHVPYHWQNKDYGAVIWWGHGADTWTQVGPNEAADGVLFANSYASTLDNAHPSFLFPNSCNNGYPETTDNLCVAVLRNGGIGILSPSRVSWYAVAQWDTSFFAAYSDNASYNYNTANRMISQRETIGQAINWVHQNGGLEWEGCSLMNHFDFNIYGDPSASLFQNSVAIITDPVSLTNNPGSSASFMVTAAGAEPLYYQWQKDAANIGSATNTTYTIAPVAPGDAGYYRCIVSNLANAATSTVATLTVNGPAAITVEPVSRTNNAGSSASFTVGASGTATLYYQWQKETVNINSANSTTYTIDPVAASHAGNYRCLVSNLVNAVTSTVATLTVNAATPPSAPAGVSASDGTYTDKIAVTWSATSGASGYQVWRAGGNNIGAAVNLGNATLSSYDDNSSAIRSTTMFYYWVKAWNSVATSDFSNVDSGFCRMGTDPEIISGQPAVGDYDGDGKADPAVYDLASGRLFAWLSSAGYFLVTPVTTFQVSVGNLPVAGDFDGDGLADPGVFNRVTGSWYIWLSSAGYYRIGPVLCGLNANDIPVPQDYDGDRTTDPAVYQTSSGGWYVWLSSAGYMKVGPFLFQQSLADIPVPGQFDSSHLANPAVYQQASGAWYLWLSGAGYIPLGPFIFSTTEDHIAVPADYDGDGLCDPAAYVPALGKWRMWMSGNGYGLTEMELK